MPDVIARIPGFVRFPGFHRLCSLSYRLSYFFVMCAVLVSLWGTLGLWALEGSGRAVFRSRGGGRAGMLCADAPREAHPVIGTTLGQGRPT